MAQIELITAKPGAGKSLLAITKGLAFLKEGRTVYAAGFKELDYEATGFLPLPTPLEAFDKSNVDDNGLIKPDWMLLENSVIIYDECYSVIPSRAAGRPVPVHIAALARHRHYNIDFILVTQKHDQIDSFVRGLVGQHIHVRRKFGLNGAVLKTWDHFELNAEKAKPDSSPYWKYPKQNFRLYKSATAHSVKRKLPWYVWAPIPLLLLIGGLVWNVVHTFGGKAAAPATAASAAGAGVAASSRDADDDLRRRDYAKWLQPRVTGQPWTAPAWDQLQPQGVPDLYCIAVDDGRCECRTEQGTQYHVEAGVCRTIAREGVYNPFRKPMVDQRPMPREPERQREPAQPVQVQAQAVGYWPKSQIPQEYSPPEHTIVTRGSM
ncbi:zonular occludens toxin domain-containing protein [Rhodanobacter sp. KK11]|uniref:zonular occludens toxin domain-containing protein n=1 Tax=Rhodanobacter sp. KK11 TaxID=3083255 RepID=UPI0029677A80|nr:zonular occludens toxin domain-containing protein [Rhodanobacter sp. KK11]MDW2981743.1 zonular occludens toxin domain-containing protein [Rhodanobacter sp. KK11]